MENKHNKNQGVTTNHGHVTTKKKMTPVLVSDLLNQLNRDLFKEVMTIEYIKNSNKPIHVWSLYYGDEFWVMCWLNTSKKFEISYGGRLFTWWMSEIISNELALKFDGIITDEKNKKKGKKELKSYQEYIEKYLKIDSSKDQSVPEEFL